MSVIENLAGISRWRLVGDELLRNISLGRLKPGDKLPAESDLASQYGVARQTIRRAIAHLQAEGLLQPERGRGTFVTDKVFEHRLSDGATIEQSLTDSGLSGSRLLEAVTIIAATPALAAALQIIPDSPVLYLRTVSAPHADPVATGRFYFPDRAMPALRNSLSALDAGDNPAREIAQALSLLCVEGYRRRDFRLRSRRPTTEEQTILHLGTDDHVVETEETCVDAKGRPIFHAAVSYNGSKVEFVIGEEHFLRPADQSAIAPANV